MQNLSSSKSMDPHSYEPKICTFYHSLHSMPKLTSCCLNILCQVCKEASLVSVLLCWTVRWVQFFHIFGEEKLQGWHLKIVGHQHWVLLPFITAGCCLFLSKCFSPPPLPLPPACGYLHKVVQNTSVDIFIMEKQDAV